MRSESCRWRRSSSRQRCGCRRACVGTGGGSSRGCGAATSWPTSCKRCTGGTLGVWMLWCSGDFWLRRSCRARIGGMFPGGLWCIIGRSSPSSACTSGSKHALSSFKASTEGILAVQMASNSSVRHELLCGFNQRTAAISSVRACASPSLRSTPPCRSSACTTVTWGARSTGGYTPYSNTTSPPFRSSACTEVTWRVWPYVPSLPRCVRRSRCSVCTVGTSRADLTSFGKMGQ
mmetsp:Transcript_2314/g.5500  ORF Transcript_2314/g.5500 Transcript_2314/m.5500 type:complete len:233 (+) Transcript_2314:940-1638(+)